MVYGKFNKEVWTRNNLFSRTRRFFKNAARLMVALFLLIGATGNTGAETSLPEYQVKALFLLNFVKYVDWPVEAFPDASASIVIGVLGENTIGEELDNAVKDKNINGRKIVIHRIAHVENLNQCHILFISNSEKKHLNEIFAKTKTRPVLTVGETEHFAQQGGIINFVKKEGKVRLEINADSAVQSGLQISSKLLNVADVVRGRQR
jgi:hypothetical protein